VTYSPLAKGKREKGGSICSSEKKRWERSRPLLVDVWKASQCHGGEGRRASESRAKRGGGKKTGGPKLVTGCARERSKERDISRRNPGKKVGESGGGKRKRGGEQPAFALALRKKENHYLQKRPQVKERGSLKMGGDYADRH